MKKEIKIVLPISAALLLIFAFVDLELSIRLYNPESMYGIIFGAFGSLPSVLIAFFVGSVFVLFKGEYMPGRITSVVLGVIFFLWGILNFIIPLYDYLDVNILFPIAVLSAGIVFSIWATDKIPEIYRRKAFTLAKVGALLLVFSIVVINLIKTGWGRMRFYEIVEQKHGFTSWFFPQGFATENAYKSFPSGHTSGATEILIITLIPEFFPRFKDKKILFYLISYTWIILVAISRIVIGAHFGSDVTMGFLITWAIFMFIKKILLYPKKR